MRAPALSANDGPVKALLVAALIAMLSTDAVADEWTAADYGLQSTVIALLAVDYLQTTQIVEDGMENNPIIGERGEVIPPALYFATVAATHTFAMVALPRQWRRLAMGVTIGFETKVIGTNWSAGYAMSF